MPPTVTPSRDRITYRSTRTVGPVERRLAHLTGRTVGGVHQHLLVLRADAEVAVRVCLEVGQPERAVWLVAPALALLEGAPAAACLNDAATSEQEADGAEDVEWERYRAAPSPAAFRLYERRAHRAIARTLTKLAAGRALHGLIP